MVSYSCGIANFSVHGEFHVCIWQEKPTMAANHGGCCLLPSHYHHQPAYGGGCVYFFMMIKIMSCEMGLVLAFLVEGLG